jgi:multidrug efflux pump subunit AcrA (membrane-fusion protein)
MIHHYRISRRLHGCILLLMMANLLAGCFWPAEDEEPLSFTLPANFSNVPLAVGTQTYTVTRGDVVRTLVFNGLVQAGTQRELYFTVKGPITAIHVENGETVQPGDLLIELDAEEAMLNLAEAQLVYRQAELRVAQAETSISYAVEVARLNLEIAELRLDKLQWDPKTPREDVEMAQREVDLARAAVARAEEGTADTGSIDVTLAQVQLQMAELNLNRAQRQLDSLLLKAPIAGTVRLGQDLRVGYPVDAYVSVARIVDPSSLVIESNLVADDQSLLYEGMPVEIEVNYLRGVTFAGEITLLPQPYGSGNTSLTQIVPDLSNSNLSLREGAGVTVYAEVGHREDVLWLPNSAIQTVAGQNYVVVRDGDRLREQEVQIGLVGDERTEIVDGLSEGMLVMGR